jgi:hypothetical protein
VSHSTRPPNKRQLDRFLKHLAETLNVTAAAKLAGVGRSTVYRLRKHDRTFAEAWLEAEAEAIDKLEAATYRYATEGAEERTYDADGNLVSRRVREDPASAARLLAAHRPALYSERHRLEIGGRVDVEHQLASGPVISIDDVIAMHKQRELEPAGEVIEVEDEPVEGGA